MKNTSSSSIQTQINLALEGYRAHQIAPDKLVYGGATVTFRESTVLAEFYQDGVGPCAGTFECFSDAVWYLNL